MMTRVAARGGCWVVVSGDEPMRTPMGAPVASRHRALLEEVAGALGRHGADPTTRLIYGLQASLLDCGAVFSREDLERSVVEAWPGDFFVHRPVDPRTALSLMALWGPVDLNRAGFAAALTALRLRQLVTVVVAGLLLGSAMLGLKVVATDRKLGSLARGACPRHFAFLASGGRSESGRVHFGAPTGCRAPSDPDDAYCRQTCCAGSGVGHDFPSRCALVPLFDTLRRFAAFPDEAFDGFAPAVGREGAGASEATSRCG